LNQKKIALSIAAVFFFGWLGILLAGSDRPPPPPFLLIVLIDLLAAVVVYWRVPTYMAWSRTGRSYRLLQALGEGFVAGLLIALVVLLTPWSGEPSVRPGLTDHLIWFAVLGSVGAGNAVAIYGASAYLSKHVRTSRNSEI
jgi:hypothetical protein